MVDDYPTRLRTYLKKGLGVMPRRLDVYEQAFRHRSHVHEAGDAVHLSNERMEFLGDSVIGLAVVHHLIQRYGESDEGDLSKMKAQVGSRQTLGEVGRRLGLAEFLRLGRGEEISKSQNLPSLIGNAFEALVGAIYLDHGFEYAARWVTQTLEPEFNQDLVANDYKSVLQEFAQRRFHQSPFYQVLRSYGPEHRKTFEVYMKLNGKVYGKGRGNTKKDAEQDAARHALKRFGHTPAQAAGPVESPIGGGEDAKWFWPFAKKKGKERLI